MSAGAYSRAASAGVDTRQAQETDCCVDICDVMCCCLGGGSGGDGGVPPNKAPARPQDRQHALKMQQQRIAATQDKVFSANPDIERGHHDDRTSANDGL